AFARPRGLRTDDARRGALPNGVDDGRAALATSGPGDKSRIDGLPARAAAADGTVNRRRPRWRPRVTPAIRRGRWRAGLAWVTKFLSFLYPTRAECPSRRPCCSSRVLLIITFYRGIWCPYCRSDLMALMNATFEVQSRGGSLAAIARETAPNSNRRFQQQHRVDFPILNDATAAVARSFGIGWTDDYLHAL